MTVASRLTSGLHSRGFIGPQSVANCTESVLPSTRGLSKQTADPTAARWMDKGLLFFDVYISLRGKSLMRPRRYTSVQGRSSPLRQWCISPLFQISPCFRKEFQTRGKFSSTTNLKFLPYFCCLSKFPPISENYYSLYFCKFPPDFVKFKCFLHTFCVFRFPPTLTMMHLCSVRIAGGVGGLNPPTSPCRPPTSGQNSTQRVEFHPSPT